MKTLLKQDMADKSSDELVLVQFRTDSKSDNQNSKPGTGPKQVVNSRKDGGSTAGRTFIVKEELQTQDSEAVRTNNLKIKIKFTDTEQ